MTIPSDYQQPSYDIADSYDPDYRPERPSYYEELEADYDA